MSQDKFIADAISKAGLTAPVVLGKTQELLRKLLIKMPIGHLKKAEICRHLIVIEIACLTLNLPLDKTKIVAQAPVTSKIYQEGLIRCMQALKIQRDSDTLGKLAVQFGTHLKAAALSLLEQYKRLYIDKLQEDQRALVNSNPAVYQAAAFFIVSLKSKVKLIKSAVAAVAEVDASYFSNVVDSMLKILKAHLGEEIISEAGNPEIPKRKKITLSNRNPNKIARIAGIAGTNHLDKRDAGSSSSSARCTTMNDHDNDRENNGNIENQGSEIHTSSGLNVRRISVNPLDIKNRKSEHVKSLINKINEDKLEHDKYVLERQNSKNGARNMYDKWKEGIEKKRKIVEVAVTET